MRIHYSFLVASSIFLPSLVFGACDCASTDSASPCAGQSITVTVNADTPNDGTAVDNVYSWAFNSGGGDARCGQFANGDYWVAPAVGQSTVTVTGISSSSHPTLISADENPETEAIGLLSGVKGYGNYSSSENILPYLPKSYSSITSIVAAIQRNEVVEGKCGTISIEGECVDSYNVLTIVSAVPPLAGVESIRPNITGKTKELLALSDFDLTRLPKKSFLSGADSTGLADITRRWSHSIETIGLHSSANAYNGYSEGGRAFRSHVVVGEYGAGAAVAYSSDLMAIFSDDNTDQEKKAPVAAMLTYGLDLYHAIYDAPDGIVRDWGSGATQHVGKFMPVVFLAALAKDAKYANNVKTASSHLWDRRFSGPSELAQVLPGANGLVWGDIQPHLEVVNYHGAYWDSLMKTHCYDNSTIACNTNAGSSRTMLDPYGFIDGPPVYPGGYYMQSSLGVQRAMVASMFLMPEICDIINYDALVQYVDRTINHGKQTGNDPCVTPDSREDFANCDPYRNKGCLYYGVTWGPKNPADINSECITTPTPPYNKAGRYSSLDGDPIETIYTTGQVEANWVEIRGTAGSCRAPRYHIFRNVRLPEAQP